MLLVLSLILAVASLCGFNAVAAASGQNREAFRASLQALSSFEDRSTGTPGSQAAAAYIREFFETLGFQTVGTQKIAVPVVQTEKSTLTLADRGLTVSIRAIRGNAVMPETIAPPGLRAPLIYVERGELGQLNGKQIEGAVVLMELDSGKNWLNAVNLGAKALIYVDRQNSPKMFLQEKFELSPVQFPRFWMPLIQVRELFGAFENAAQGRVADEIELICDAKWRNVTAENVYCIVEGVDPQLKEQMILVEAFYDSRPLVAGLSPGADEALSAATLLELARFLKAHPPQRTVLLVATAGHAQTLTGMRELIWSLASRALKMRHMRKDLKDLIKKTRMTVEALKSADFGQGSATVAGSDDAVSLADEALKERVKTEADKVSRRLMHLRLQRQEQVDRGTIKQLAAERQLLRRLLWRTSYTAVGFTPEEQQKLSELVPLAVADQQAVLADARTQLTLVESARSFRGQAKTYDLMTAVSLHLSSHGDGFGAFNYGWLYPFRPRINRVAAYSLLDEVLRQGKEQIEQSPGYAGIFKDTLRPSRRQSWESYFIDRPHLGGEVSALAGYHGLTFATTHDARANWGTPHDILEKVDLDFALKQSAVVCGLVQHLAQAAKLHEGIYPRDGLSSVTGRAKFLRQGELFADQPAPGTVLLAYQGPARYHVIVDHMGMFYLNGLADKKHSFHKVIFEGYKFDDETGEVVWTIDKKKTGKDAYRVKMFRPYMETDLVMFAANGTTIFNLLEPRTFRYLTKGNVIDGRREADPLRFFYSRLDTWQSTLTSVFLEPGTPLKMTLSDTVLRKKMLLLHSNPNDPQGSGYMIEKWPFLYRTQYRVAQDMWALIKPRIANLEKRGIFNERIRSLQDEGLAALKTADRALTDQRYDIFSEASAKSWALASRVYDDVEKTQKDVLYGVLFYIALFVPFAFCLERLLFSYSNIYKRIIAFGAILLLLIVIIYNVHPAFRLAYSPMVVILAFFIMGLSVIVTLIIFFRFEDEVTRLQSRAKLTQSGEIGRWKAFVAAFLLGVSNLRRRRLRTILTCATLIILTFTIMSFTSAKSMRRHARVLYDRQTPYIGFLLKNVNWRELPPQAFGTISNAFAGQGTAVPRVWLENEDQTRATRIPIYNKDRTFVAQGMVGLSDQEGRVTGMDEILIGGRWLTADDRQAVLLPERMAVNLGIDPLNPEGHTISLWGMPFEVRGVFSGTQLQERVDLDGEPLTPVTFPRETSTEMTEEVVEALESGDDVREFQSRYQHTSGDLTVIVPYRTLLAAGGNLKGVAIRLRSRATIQDTARDLIDRFGLSLFSGEPDGTYLYNASDSMSYSGVPNIIIPLIISVFIVLNTMIGSVYERKREIGIYTSVGLAPSHVSFLFIAEALAFAVLSVVFGYLLAQITAKLFAETSLWSGITVNYSSMSGVAAMLLVIAVVLVSVIYPSKVAGEIAMPDVNRSWVLPAARENELEVTLPFLMTYKEHRSIGGFLYEYFEGHQDISHGMFSTADVGFDFIGGQPPGPAGEATARPEAGVESEKHLQIRSRVWLTPFDLGIMQQVTIQFRPAEDEAGFLEIHVQLYRESGEANAWYRINKSFLHDIRRQLLIWRSFEDTTKTHYEQLLLGAEKELGIRS